MLATEDKTISDISNTPVNMTSQLTLDHIDSFRHAVTAGPRPVVPRDTEMNNNNSVVTTQKDSPQLHESYLPLPQGVSGNGDFVYSAHQPYKYTPSNNNTRASHHESRISNVQKPDNGHVLNNQTDSIEHVSNAHSHSVNNLGGNIVPIFYRDTSASEEESSGNKTSNSEQQSLSSDLEQPCKKRRISDPREATQNQRTEMIQNQPASVVHSEQKDKTDVSVYPYPSLGSENFYNSEKLRKTPDPSPNQAQFYNNYPYYLPFYHPPHHSLPTPDSQQVPQVNGTTFLTPSRLQSPIMSTYQTPKVRAKQTCQRRLSSPTDSERSCDRSCDEDSEIDVISDARDTSITVESKDSDVSMTSLKSSKSTSPSDNSSTGSPSTISPEDGCRKKTRTNYTPMQVQTLEKVFHENPYPDAEKMEQLSKELDIPENKLKVWFQNKRARWRRRMNDNAHQVPRYMGFSPMMSPMSNFGFMGHMMPPPMSPAQVVPGHFVRPGPPTSPSTTSQSPKQNSQVTPPHQTRGHFPQYMPVYPYGMFSPYYYS